MTSKDHDQNQLKDDGNDSEFVKALRTAINPLLDKLSIEANSNVPSVIKPIFFTKLRNEVSKVYGQNIEKLIKENHLIEVSATLAKLKNEQADNQNQWRPNRDVNATLQPLKDETNARKKKYLLKLIKVQEEVNELKKKRYNETFQEVQKNFTEIHRLKKDQIKFLQEQNDAIEKSAENLFMYATQT